MRIVFVSCVELGWHCLKTLLDSKEDVVGIFTLPEKFTSTVSGYKSFQGLAAKHRVPLFKVRNINDRENIEILRQLMPDMIFIIGWPQLVSKAIIDIPKYGCVGMHPTLLPKGRGRAPVPWSLIKGLTKSGEGFLPNFYVDITDYLDIKINALSLYQSQIREDPHALSLENVRRLAELRGREIYVKSAEVFVCRRFVT